LDQPLFSFRGGNEDDYWRLRLPLTLIVMLAGVPPIFTC
jgi:hypothetical protein